MGRDGGRDVRCGEEDWRRRSDGKKEAMWRGGERMYSKEGGRGKSLYLPKSHFPAGILHLPFLLLNPMIW